MKAKLITKLITSIYEDLDVKIEAVEITGRIFITCNDEILIETKEEFVEDIKRELTKTLNRFSI